MIYTYGYRYPMRKIGAAFNPLTDINGLSLYINKGNATVSSWLDQSPNAFNFEQATGTKQPSIGANSVDYDGIDDFQEEVVVNAYSGDSSGIMFFCGYFNNGAVNYYLSSSDISVADMYINFGVLDTGEIFIQVNEGGDHRLCHSTTQVVNGAFFYGEIKTDGLTYTMKLDGGVETVLELVGSNDGKFFSFVSGRDNLNLSRLIRSTATAYSPNSISGMIYTNDHTITNVEAINNFMSDPNNFI